MKRHRDTKPSNASDMSAGKSIMSNGDLDPASELKVRVVVVSSRASIRRRLSSMLHGHVESLNFVDNATEAVEQVSTSSCDLVVIERALDGCDGIDLLYRLSTNHPALVGVILGQVENTEDAVRAMRAGACDLISIQNRNAQTTRQLLDSVKRAQRIRQRDARLDRLKKLCHKLNSARQEVSGQVGELCTDLVEAYKDLSEQFGDVKIATEFNAIIRQELEIESLLRTMLEFALSKIGSTNAAVFLPTSTGDYSLGAYVNYDIPRDAAEILLDQLADVMAPRFEDTNEVVSLNGQAEMDEVFGNDSHWLEDCSAMIVSCQHDDECLAVLSLFRDQTKEFSEDDIRILTIIAKLFGEQLGRVIRVHHRHLPKDQWGAIDTGSYDDADDDDFFSSDDDHYGFAA
ncbi:MAG: response regulator [Phycisphaerales bacterium]|nr:response regulator [Phycisphaerales bacterium]